MSQHASAYVSIRQHMSEFLDVMRNTQSLKMKRNCAESGGGTRCDDHPNRSYVVVKEVEEDSFLTADVLQ